MARVEFEHVEKLYPGGTRAIADLTLGVEDGELLAIVGPSGCGKSTLLRLLAGLEPPSAGVLRIGGRVVNELPPQERNVAMVFQDYALYPHLSVRRNLEFPLRMRRMPRAESERRVGWAARLLRLEPLLERLPRQLSGGERQRVAMGRALVREPAVFLLDEPLSNLDATLRVQVRSEIEELQRRTATTMLYVTHDQVEAMTLGRRVAVMHEGRLHQVAAPREIYERPANVFVAGFVGSPPMNLFEVRLEADARGRPALAVAGVLVPIAGTPLAAGPARVPGARLTAGVRPEHLALVTEASEGALHGAVEHVESLGHETLVYVRVLAARGSEERDAPRLVARLEGMHALARGDAAHLRADPARLHLFDAEGRAVAA
jgi:multiple sugar transport system ATP-binding protein